MNNLNVAKIQLNGSPYEINIETNLNQLLNKLKIKTTKVAIEVNGAIVEKNKYPKVILNKGDKVEIVHFIGGG
ncbi:MAG TPA: sulfur carrier protein ThiS [Pelagibacteraceae bacterium]|jgi:thiamine biosynthesis protein ThiS|nr:sulfur carrier protein ThiS [Pelagibacterales bacterium]RUA14930.1 MAG: thiamine biosynthesis protein ThiS [Alphaproteobacteria bacterium]HIN07229.1 sulfur carrier protein ThiS [Pelagibacteraceae bacterium]